MMRVVVVEGVLVPDLRARIPGRGAWVHPTPECLDLAERRRAFARALRVPGPLDVAAVRSEIASRAATRSPDPAAPPRADPGAGGPPATVHESGATRT
jgi:predicted RNA-binding protein YlxR (DUF448 family)